MVVGAGAAFSDQSKIKNTEAVDACTALNIIGGYPDGSFKPEGNITRAEVTKMICVALNGGKNPAVSTNTTPTFSDVRNNANAAWAEGYIESCAAQGIVSGVGGGKFAPNGNVTGVQLAKMLLVSLGYKADLEGFTGNAWATNVNVIATQRGLYEDLETMDTNAALTRDNAAQMIWNALKATEVEYKYTLDGSNGNLSSKAQVVDKTRIQEGTEKDVTMLFDKYSVDIIEAAILTSISADDKGTYSVVTTNNPATIEQEGDSYNKVEKDYSELMGQAVDVLVKDGNNSKVFGIYANEDSTVVATGICDDLDTVSGNAQKVKVDSTEYKTQGALNTIDVYEFNGTNPAGKLSTYIDNNTVAPYSIKLIDNDGDGKIDRAVVVPFQVYEVTYVGSSSLTLKTKGSIDKEDAIVDKNLAKDDYAMFVGADYNSADKDTLTKVAVVTGKVSAVKDNSTVQVDGTWYKKAASSADTLSDADLDSTVELQVVNGFYFAADVTVADASSTNILYVSAADTNVDPNLGDPTLTIKAYFADGTNKKVDVVEVNDKDVSAVQALAANKSANMDGYVSANGTVVVGAMYRYETNKSGEYKLYSLANDTSKNRAGYKTYAQSAKTNSEQNYNADSNQYNTASFNTNTDRLTVANTSFTVADDATVFVQTTANQGVSGDKVKVITGKALKKWATTDNLFAQVLSNDNNGTKTAKVVTVVYTATHISAASDDSYGFVVEAPRRVTNSDGDKVWQYQIWNGSKTITVFEDETSANAAKGNFIQYNVVGTDEIEIDTAFAGTYAAVTAIDGKNIDVTMANGNEKTALEIDTEDTDVIYVNTKDTKGVEGGSIALADEPSNGNYTMNAYIASASINDGETLDVIFFDVNNKMEDAATTMSTGTGAAITAALAANDVTFTGTLPDSGIVVPADKTLTITVAQTKNAVEAIKAEKSGAKLILKAACGEMVAGTYTATVTGTGDAATTTWSK